jgi:hypothetical protein
MGMGVRDTATRHSSHHGDRRARAPWRWGATAVVVAAGLSAALRLPDSWRQGWQAGIYPAIQMHVTPVSQALPASALDVLTVGLVCVVCAVFWWRVGRGQAARLAGDAALIGAVLWLTFLLSWGWHYQAPTIEQRLTDRRAEDLTPAHAVRVARHAVSVLNATHAAAHAEPWPDTAALTAATARLMREVLPDVGVAWHPVLPDPRRSLADRYFRWAGISGMTNPFGLDIILNTRLLDVERPAVLAHEWAHLAGFADESDASFVAWMAGARGGPQQRYSAWLSLLPHLLGAVPAADRAGIVAVLEEGPRQDLSAIAVRASERLPAVSTVAWRVYDRFLKVNRVSEGVARYDAVTRLMLYGADIERGTLRRPIRSSDSGLAP